MKRKLMSLLLACALALYGPLPAYGDYAAAPLDTAATAGETNGGSRIIDIHELFDADSIVTASGNYSGDCQYLLNGDDVGSWRKESSSGTTSATRTGTSSRTRTART